MSNQAILRHRGIRLPIRMDLVAETCVTHRSHTINGYDGGHWLLVSIWQFHAVAIEECQRSFLPTWLRTRHVVDLFPFR